jgi:hypothetical protein
LKPVHLRGQQAYPEPGEVREHPATGVVVYEHADRVRAVGRMSGLGAEAKV